MPAELQHWGLYHVKAIMWCALCPGHAKCPHPPFLLPPAGCLQPRQLSPGVKLPLPVSVPLSHSERAVWCPFGVRGITPQNTPQPAQAACHLPHAAGASISLSPDNKRAAR